VARVAEWVHGRFVHSRRVRVLAEHLLPWLASGARVLDVGAGDGALAARLAARRPDLSLHCVDVQVRPTSLFPIQLFDGAKLPFSDGAFDAVVLADVLHHTVEPLRLLEEVRRVTRGRILLKDHALDGAFAGITLRFMDWIGNARHGVPLPFNYWPSEVWRETFSRLGLSLASWRQQLELYPWPARLLFDRRLHFLAVLDSEAGNARARS
jgi:SAM-dependent methyltransferase